MKIAPMIKPDPYGIPSEQTRCSRRILNNGLNGFQEDLAVPFFQQRFRRITILDKEEFQIDQVRDFPSAHDTTCYTQIIFTVAGNITSKNG